jgi:crotonobetaine/carnitine-CoA ligase
VLRSEERSAGLRDLGALSVGDFLREAAAERSDAVFLVSGDRHITYAAFDRRVDRAAAAWQALGVEKGDRVAFMMANRPAFIEAWMGLARAGGVLVAINTRWQEEEIGYFLGLTEPRLALVGEEFTEVFGREAAGSSSLTRVLGIGHDEDFEDAVGRMDSVLTSSARTSLVTVRSNDPVSFISTSGTTGRPKAVIQTNGNFVLTGEGYASWVELRPGERIYLCLPLFHINSQAYTVMGAIAARATIVMVERFSASRFWDDMNRYGVNVFNFVGSMLAILLQRTPSAEERSHRVRLAYGGPIPTQPSRAQIEARFHLTLISGIGMSENTFGLIEPVRGDRRDGSLGRPRQHPDGRIVNEARVVDESGHPLPAGRIGELVYRNPVMTPGYYQNPEGTADAIRDGWLYTGDLVRQDEEGNFYFVDRKKDIIRVKGENVAPAEVEHVLARHPDVLEVAVIGVPSPLTEDEVAAFVLPRPGATPQPDELTDWCTQSLASFKIPRYVWFVDSFPKTETQRIEKHRLRERARELLSGGVEGGAAT